MFSSIPRYIGKSIIALSLLIFIGRTSLASEINLRQEILQSQARVTANASQILTEQGKYLIDVQYRLNPLSVSIYGKLPDDLDQPTLEDELKSFIATVPKDQKVTWPVFHMSGYKVLVNTSSPFSIMEQAISVKANLFESLISDTYFIYTAFSQDCSNFKIKEIFNGFQEDDRIELESKIRDIIDSKPGKPMIYYLNRISKIKQLSSGKYIRSLAGFKIIGSPKGFVSENTPNAPLLNIHQAIDNFFEHGTRDIKVKTWNFDENRIEDQPVVRNFRTLATHILRLYLKDNHGTISTTSNHPFFVAGKGWVKAGKLKSGDVLVGQDSRVQVAGIRLEKLPKPMYLYNLEVEKYNNYFVVSEKTKKPMLVHNCNEEDIDELDEDRTAIRPQGWDDDGQDLGETFKHVCFTGDTQIKLKHGSKSIKLVDVGDEVLSCNDKTNTCEYRKVKKIYWTRTKELVHVKAEGMAHAIKSTPNHPYFVAELNDYAQAKDLKEGQHLVYQDPLTKENRLDVIESIEKEPLDHEIPVYNFGVHKNENYYVAAANEFGDNIYNKRFYLVHNCSHGLSIALDFSPVGGVKGVGEAFYGKDLVTQDDLAWWERCLAAGTIIPGAGPALKRIAKAAKTVSKDEKILREFAKIEKEAEKAIAVESKIAQHGYPNDTFNPGKWQGPVKGTGNEYRVFKNQKIDWSLKKDGISNLERAKRGQAPFIEKDGKLVRVELHHVRQDAKGPLAELSRPTHQSKKGQGREVLHPYGTEQHPHNPVDRTKWDKDRKQFWKDRAKEVESAYE